MSCKRLSCIVLLFHFVTAQRAFSRVDFRVLHVRVVHSFPFSYFCLGIFADTVFQHLIRGFFHLFPTFVEHFREFQCGSMWYVNVNGM